MTADLYAAWLTAGAWTARNWTNLALAAVIAVAGCLIWQALRDANRQVDDALGGRPEQPATRKEDRP